MLIEHYRNPRGFEVFLEHMPKETKISKTKIEEIPTEVLEFFEWKTNQHREDKDNYKPEDLKNLLVITHSDKTQTYCAQTLHIYPANWTSRSSNKLNKEELTLLANTTQDNQLFGWGYIRKPLIHKRLPTNQPFVGYTYTGENETITFRNQGFGTRRLKTMHALSKMIYDLPLHSAITIAPEALSIWKHLVEQGIARTFKEKDYSHYSWKRFVFKE